MSDWNQRDINEANLSAENTTDFTGEFTPAKAGEYYLMLNPTKTDDTIDAIGIRHCDTGAIVCEVSHGTPLASAQLELDRYEWVVKGHGVITATLGLME